METNKIIKGEVFKISEDLWQARIFDGWYVDFGKTKEAAIKKVENKYYKEQEKLQSC